jgi:P-47 protein
MRSDGWHSVFACSSAYMNRRLATETANYAFSFRYEDAGVILEGVFDAWSIAPDGSGEILQFHTPIKSGTATIKSTEKKYKLDGAVPLVQMQLAFIDGVHPGQQKSLVFNCSTVGKKAGDRTTGAVTVLNPDTSGKVGLDPLARDLIVPALSNCFVANRDKLAFVFADVALTPTQNASWMVLRSVAYCYQQDIQGELGSFAVLGMFDNVDISGHSKTFDSSLLRPGDDFGFILSGTELLAHVILPGLPAGFRGSSAREFQMSGARIVNNGQIHLESIKVGLIWYPPHINTLNMHIENNYINTYLDGRCPITGLEDAYVDFSMSEKEVARFDFDAEAFKFSATDKQVTHSTQIPWWEKLLGALFTFGLMNAIVDAVGLALENAVGSHVSGSGLDAARLGAFQVQWSPGSKFKLTDGGLQDNFYCRGRQQA